TNAEDRCFWVVDDRCRTVNVEHPVVVDSEGAAREVADPGLTFASQGCQTGKLGREFHGVELMRLTHVGNNQSALGLRCEAQVDPLEEGMAQSAVGFGVDAAVHFWETCQPCDGEA